MVINNLTAAAESGYPLQLTDGQAPQWQLHSCAMRPLLRQAGVWLHADSIPDLCQVRQLADQEAAGIYESHMSELREGRVDTVPLDSNSISAADRAWDARRLYGQESEQYAQAYTGVVVNFQRYLAETWSKLGPEYFRPLYQPYDHRRGDYLSFGVPVTPMIQRGITPLAEAGEVPRRLMENRENATNNRLGKLIMRAAGVALDDGMPEVALPGELQGSRISSQTISECPDHIIARYEQDRRQGLKRQYGGYAPQIKKLMLRDTAYDLDTGDRFVEQLSVSGEHISHDVVLAYYELKGVTREGEAPDKTEVLGLQVVTDSTEGAMGMARDLDLIAGGMTGKNLFLGQEVADGHPKDYSAFPSQAAVREAKQMEYARELAEYSMRLSAAGVDHVVGNKMVDDMVARQMFALAKEDDQFAEVALDAETAAELRRARLARSRGDHRTAELLERRAEKLAPPPEGCSGGACQVADVDVQSVEGRSLAKLLRAKAGDKIAKDEGRVRRCKCGGQIAYAYNASRVNKVCLACKVFESKASFASDDDK